MHRCSYLYSLWRGQLRSVYPIWYLGVGLYDSDSAIRWTNQYRIDLQCHGNRATLKQRRLLVSLRRSNIIAPLLSQPGQCPPGFAAQASVLQALRGLVKQLF